MATVHQRDAWSNQPHILMTERRGAVIGAPTGARHCPPIGGGALMVYLPSQCDEHAEKYPNEEPAPDDRNQDACKNHYRGPDGIPGLSWLRCTGLPHRGQ
jgi:hypothetical protein